MEIELKKKKKGSRCPGHGFPNYGKYWDIIKVGRKKPIGFVGYTTIAGAKQVQVYVDPYYRGKGIGPQAEDILAEKLGLDYLDAVVMADNPASKRAHEKAGWKLEASMYTKKY